METRTASFFGQHYWVFAGVLLAALCLYCLWTLRQNAMGKSTRVMRLAFSVATVVNPDILIVDEILAVGDADFQKKSKARMMELMHGGTTVLFVSHRQEQIREMCDRVLWLEHGEMKMLGATAEVCGEYERQ